uniref:MARVEL domain-containing protein n=1 Tax=Rhipicephalus appendiculatus TaxID=34631 RepID=A0A131YRJ6_RHIAP
MVQFYIREYTMTTDGWLNLLEVVVGAILWAMYGTLGATTPSEQFLYSCASVFATNGFFFFMSSVMSIQTALMLPKLFYYTLFQLVSAACYISGGVATVGNSSVIDGIVAIVCGVLHLVHFVYSMIKN